MSFFARSLSLGVVVGAAPDSSAQTLAPLPDEAWNLSAARHLLDRAGFGGTPEEIAEFHSLGLEGAVDRLLARASERKPLEVFEAEFVRKKYREMLPQGMDKDSPEAQQLRKDAIRDDRAQFERYREFWLAKMTTGEEPLREKLALFWHGYFTSAQREVRDSYAMARQIELYRGWGLGSFSDLLHRASKEPAMLEYLNNDQNKKQAPNENFAREVMELFTMGPGNYSEGDIKEAARAFTGWGQRDGEFAFLRGRHDFGEKTFLGRSGKFGGEEILDILLEQEATSRFVATKLFEFFVRPNPEPKLVDSLAATLRAHDLDVAAFLGDVLRSREFYSQESQGALFKSPIEFAVSTVRRLGIKEPPYAIMVEACERLGQELLNPPNVKGWDGGEAWISASSLLQRANFARVLVLGRDAAPGGGKGGRGGDEMVSPRVRKDLKDFRPELAVADWIAGAQGSRGAVARLCDRFLAVAPTRATVEDLANYVAPFGDDAFDPADPDTERLLRDVVHMILCLPEYQLN